MRRIAVVFSVLAALCVAVMNVPSGFAQEHKAGQLMIEHPWARPSLGKAPNSAAYMKITNHGTAPDKLVGVKTDAAKEAQLHTVEMQKEVMRMRRIKGGITIPAKGSVELKPGGNHIMLVDLTKNLTQGGMINLTLEFERQGDVPVQVKIEKTGGMGAGAMKHEQMKHDAIKGDQSQGGHKH